MKEIIVTQNNQVNGSGANAKRVMHCRLPLSKKIELAEIMRPLVSRMKEQSLRVTREQLVTKLQDDSGIANLNRTVIESTARDFKIDLAEIVKRGCNSTKMVGAKHKLRKEFEAFAAAQEARYAALEARVLLLEDLLGGKAN